MALLMVSGVGKKEKEAYTLKDISFEQQRFQKMAIAGDTGSGKTTLLKLVGGLLQPDEGTIVFEEKKVRGPNDQLIPGHAGIAYLSQHFELRNNYWVHEILSYANNLGAQEAANLYSICRIDHLLNRRTDQLSGGEKQRIALTRLLIGSPRLLLLDEPFSNLDAVHKTIIRSVVDDINQRLGISCIMVSHDAPDILPWADTILVLKDGRLVQQGRPEQVYRQPSNEYCAGLFGDYSLLPSREALLLNPFAEAVHPEKQLLVRPEQVVINAAGTGLQVKVQQLRFMGSYYQLETVTAAGQIITTRIAGNSFAIGESLLLSSSADWWI